MARLNQPVAPPRRVLSRTLPDLLRENATKWPDNISSLHNERSVTFRDMLSGVEAVGAGLRSRGLGRGDRVGLLMPNGPNFLQASIGAMAAGCVVVPISTWSTASELEFILEDAGLRAVFAADRFGDRSFADELSGLARANPADVIAVPSRPHGPDEWRALLNQGASSRPDDSDDALCATDDAFVLYTSGSTSTPKAVRLQHFGIIENGFHIGERQGLTADDKVFLTAPLFWSYGCANALPAAFTHGSALVTVDRFDPAEALDIIERHRCTSLYGMPGMIKAMRAAEGFSKSRTASLRTGLTIGSAQDFLATVHDFGIPELCNVYGATETYGNCAVTHHLDPLEIRSSCQGKPLPGQLIRIRSPETGELQPPGDVGHIEVKGYVTPGYSGASAALNASTFTSDGFYRTMDLGVLDADNRIRFVGRDSEVVKRSGINVSPSEVEDVLRRCPGVADVIVTGAPDRDRDEVLVASIIPDRGHAISRDDLARHCRTFLSSYKVPDHFVFVDAFPLTATGKVQRKLVAQAAAEAVEQDSVEAQP